jgi:hypothetical protein
MRSLHTNTPDFTGNEGEESFDLYILWQDMYRILGLMLYKNGTAYSIEGNLDTNGFDFTRLPSFYDGRKQSFPKRYLFAGNLRESADIDCMMVMEHVPGIILVENAPTIRRTDSDLIIYAANDVASDEAPSNAVWYN